MTFQEWLVALGKYREENPGQRAGQAAFNFLSEIRPELAKQIHETTNLDPFYGSSDTTQDRAVDKRVNKIRLKRFFAYVEENWDDTWEDLVPSDI